MIHIGLVLLLCWLLSLHYVVVSAHADDINGRVRFERTEHLQSIVDRLRAGLAILEPVAVSLVDAHPLVMSVETLGTRSGPFVIRVDQAFVQTLSLEEAEAALEPLYAKVWLRTGIKGNLAEYIGDGPDGQ